MNDGKTIGSWILTFKILHLRRLYTYMKHTKSDLKLAMWLEKLLKCSNHTYAWILTVTWNIDNVLNNFVQ